MRKSETPKRAVVAAIVVAAVLVVAPAQAKLQDTSGCERDRQAGDYYCFYPYASTYTNVDQDYAFAADRVQGRVYEPVRLPVREPVRRVVARLMRPRASFARKLSVSADDL